MVFSGRPRADALGQPAGCRRYRPFEAARREWSLIGRRRRRLLLLLLLLLQLLLQQLLLVAARAIIVPESLPAAGRPAAGPGSLRCWSLRPGYPRAARRYPCPGGRIIHLPLVVALRHRGHGCGRRGLRDAARFGSQDEPVHTVRVGRRTQHHVVEVRSVQQGCQNIARRPWAQVRHHPLGGIGRNLHRSAGLGPHRPQNVARVEFSATIVSCPWL